MAWRRRAQHRGLARAPAGCSPSLSRSWAGRWRRRRKDRLDGWDPEFRAEADRLALEIDPVTGETLQAMVERMFGAPREVIEAARRAIGQR